ncbi:S-layer homology domain-containing protein [Wukongibacter sp. M2B1]|uniref:S-layer homology domain-containing protein n=1 Tax=Wukongibacter sp. M2B1 TaxID=3088895 RepID=UPI003D7B3188
MKKTKILIVIALLIVFSTTTVYAKNTIFSDIKDHWAEREIINLVNQNIISGYPDGTFKLNANISRSEFSTLMYRVLGLKEEVSEEKTVVFQEIEGLWSEKFIEALVEKEVIIPDEYENGYLANKEMTRVEIAKMVIRAIGKDRRARNIYKNRIKPEKEIALFFNK